jgi:two-component system sensor histidine kinase KdpD
VCAGTVICAVTRPYLDLADKAMIYVLGVLFVASRSTRGPALFASIASVAALDFFFVPPFHTFAVSDSRYVVTFLVMLVTGILVSSLTVRIRSQAAAARERERRTAILYALTRTFAFRRGAGEIAEAARRHVEILFGTPAAVLLAGDATPLTVLAGSEHAFLREERELTVAQWVLEHGRPAGHSTDTLPAAQALYLPLAGGKRTLGVLAIALADRPDPLTASQRQLLDVFVSQSALALERAVLAEETVEARLAAETERLRSTLLATMSHDFRTPIATITGAATTLLDESAAVPSAERRDLLETIREEAERLGRLVRDLLDLNRIESGALVVHKEWCPLEEMVGAALARTEEMLAGREAQVCLPKSLLGAEVDPVLIEQVLTNLLENAAKYTPAGSPIEIEGQAVSGGVEVTVADHGPGIPPADLERVFDKFHRLAGDAHVPGTGLGLAICRAILAAHGGRIWAENRPDGGARFRFFLPAAGAPPALDDPDAP